MSRDRLLFGVVTDDRALLEAWCAAGRELVDFEIVPVRTSADAAAVMADRHP